MSKHGFISPLKVERLAITSASIEFQSMPTSPNYDVSMTMSMGLVSPDDARADDRIRVEVPLDASLEVSEDGKPDRHLGTIHVSGITTDSLPNEIVKDDEGGGALDYLRASGISILYGHMRSHMMAMSIGNPMGPFIMPAIDPVAFLKSIKENEAANEPQK